MSPIPTEQFPYTIGYVKQLLNTEESELMAMVSALSLVPREEKYSGNLVFSHQDTEILRKAFDMQRRGEPIEKIARYFGVKTASLQPSQQALKGLKPMTNLSQAHQVVRSSNGENLSVVVEAVVSAKEGILKDMSRLLDDKLTGLDEVVVELIRCKSENDSLKKQMHEIAADNEALQLELESFKPAGFGFFRKV